MPFLGISHYRAGTAGANGCSMQTPVNTSQTTANVILNHFLNYLRTLADKGQSQPVMRQPLTSFSPLLSHFRLRRCNPPWCGTQHNAALRWVCGSELPHEAKSSDLTKSKTKTIILKKEGDPILPIISQPKFTTWL